MENELALRSDDKSAFDQIAAISGQALANTSDDVFADLSKAGDYLCRIQLQGSNSKLVKLKKIECGHYAYIIKKDNFIDLGESVDVYPVMWRPMAMDMNGDTPIRIFDVKSQLFKEISERSFGTNSMCTFGPDFLVWLPEIRKFGSLHFGSKTARQDAPAFNDLLKAHKAATLTCRTIEGKKFVWEAITVNPCTTPFELPDLERTKDQVEKFVNEMNAKAPEPAQEQKRSR